MSAQQTDILIYKGEKYAPFYLANSYSPFDDVIGSFCDLTTNFMVPVLIEDFGIPKAQIESTDLLRERVGYFELENDLKLRLHIISTLFSCHEKEKFPTSDFWEFVDNFDRVKLNSLMQKKEYSEIEEYINSVPAIIPNKFSDIKTGFWFKKPMYIDYDKIYLFSNFSPYYHRQRMKTVEKILEVMPDSIKEINNPMYDQKLIDRFSNSKEKSLWNRIRSFFK